MQDVLKSCFPFAAILPTLRHGAEILCIAIFGAFGGLIYAISALLDGGRVEDQKGKAKWEATRGVSIPGFLWGQSAVGSGGAFAAAFAILTVGNAVKAGTTDTLSDYPIYMVTLCVVGGFVGNKLLNGVGSNLARQLTQAQNTANQAVDLAKVAKSEVADATKRSDMTLNVVIARDLVVLMDKAKKAGVAIGEDVRSKAEETLKQLSGYLDDFPTDRTFNIVLANLKYHLISPGAAVEHLQSYLEHRRKTNAKENDDDATAFFNIACFTTEMWKMKTGEEAQIYETKAFNAIKECLKIAQNGGGNQLQLQLSKAQRDDDLQPLRETENYKNLIEQLNRKT